MLNSKKYVVKVDYQAKVILDDHFDEVIDTFLQREVEFELILIDTNNIIDLNINTIVNQYIHDSQKENPPLCVGISDLKQFILNMLKLLSGERPRNEDIFKTIYPYDIICGRASFKVHLPENCISEKKVEELRVLGPDYIQLVLSDSAVFQYILPEFYLFLFRYDLMDNDRYNDLRKYTIGLH